MRISDWSSDVCSSDLANEDGSFEFEIVNVEVNGKKGTETISRDEQPFKAMPEKIPTLKPTFKKDGTIRSEEHTSELQSLMRISYAVFCLNKKTTKTKRNHITRT